MKGQLLIVGNPLPFHVGGHLLTACHTAGIQVSILNSTMAFGNSLLQKLHWRLGDRRPTRQRMFERLFVAQCEHDRPQWMLATGIAPLRRCALQHVERLGVKRLNYLTDDPWNPSHKSRWFLQALPAYDMVFTPRKANIDDLVRLGCSGVNYLPFAYDPGQHYPALTPPSRLLDELASDILFVGGGDQDRHQLLVPLIEAGLKVALYGGYWHSHPVTARAARGHADADTLRLATKAAKVSLCLVRRANRDGHVMRTFEAAACGACMLVEDTEEHRTIFGADGDCVAYFDSIPRMVQQARRLLADQELRAGLAAAAYNRLVASGGNTYADRLKAMLEICSAP